MMMNKEYLMNLLNQLNRTAQNRVLSDDEIVEFEKTIDDIEARKKQIYVYLKEINSLKNIEDFSWELSRINESLDNSNLVNKQLAKIYLELQYCSEQVQKLNAILLKLWFNYISPDSEEEDQLN